MNNFEILEQLRVHAGNGNIQELKSIIKSVDPDFINIQYRNNSIFRLAATNGHLLVVMLLLSTFSSINPYARKCEAHRITLKNGHYDVAMFMAKKFPIKNLSKVYTQNLS